MTVFKLGDVEPFIHPTCYLAFSAAVIGNVVLARDGSVWFGAVLRGDNERILIGERSNVQDGAVLHTDPGFPLTVGSGVTVGHQATLHGCTIGDDSLVGMQAVVLNGATIGRHCVIGAGAVVTEGKEFADRSLIVGCPARSIATVSEEQIEMIERAAESYLQRSQRYRSELTPIDSRRPDQGRKTMP